MNIKRWALGVAAAGTAVGVTGLGLIAIPAGAEEEPTLPAVGASQLVRSVLTAEPPAMGGTVRVDNQLGLPAMPGLPQLASGTSTLRVWADGEGRSRLSLPREGGAKTIVRDGETTWVWDSTKRTATKYDADARHHESPEGERPRWASDPAKAASKMVAAVREYSRVSVDGTTEVAGRPAYELVLTPKSGERTLLREVRVAVGSEHRVPLRVSVYADGATDPALRVGFTKLDVGPQDAGLFRFTPPEGATVRDGEKRGPRHDGERPTDQPKGRQPTKVGEGWDTVLVTTMPRQRADAGKQDGDARQADPRRLAKQFGKRVSGSWGSGWVVTTKVGSVLLTEDGKLAAGAVPQRVLIEAMESAR